MWLYFNSFITKDQKECLKSSNRPDDKLLYFPSYFYLEMWNKTIVVFIEYDIKVIFSFLQGNKINNRWNNTNVL